MNMPDHIAEQIKKTESYRQELRSIYDAISGLHKKLDDTKNAAKKQNWPRIYMQCRCVKYFFTSRRSFCGGFEIDYDVHPGTIVRFLYNYEEGVFQDDSNFGDFTLFTYNDYADNFEVVGYVDMLP